MLNDLVSVLESMTYDELRDFIDYVEYHHLSRYSAADAAGAFLKSVRNRRAGLPSGGFPDELQIIARDTRILKMTTPLQQQGMKAIRESSKDDLIIAFGRPVLMRSTAGAIAWALLRAKSPIRRTSQGNIQVKWIPYEQVVRGADGKPVKDDNGRPVMQTVEAPYLYLRYWQVQGDADRRKSRVKSIYIGGSTDYEERRQGGYIFRDLAQHFYDLLQEHGVERTRTIKKTGEVQTYKVRPKDDDNPIAELEQAMMVCINMDTEPPEIDYEALLKLQQERVGIQAEVEPEVKRPTLFRETVERDSELRETLSNIRLFKQMFEYAGEEFERRHGRKWRWTKITLTRSGNRTLIDDERNTFAMGTDRWQVVATLARFIETGMDHVGAFEG